MRQRRLGGGDIVVSEFGLGTQRWGSADFNAPDEAMCHKFMDYPVLEKGVSMVDTAEQYPIPSDRGKPEGDTERIIGSWMKKDKSRREKLVIATKITGSSNVTKKNIRKDLEGSLTRLGTDYVDVYSSLGSPADTNTPRIPRPSACAALKQFSIRPAIFKSL